MGNELLIYMMMMEDARKRNKAKRAIIIGKRDTDCPTLSKVIKDDNKDFMQHPATFPRAGHNFSRYLSYCPIILAIHFYRPLLDRGIRGVCI